MKIEIKGNTLQAETEDGCLTDYDNIRAIIGLLHSNKSLEGVDILKLNGFSASICMKMVVDLINDMHRPFRVVALHIDNFGFEVQQSWDRAHPPGSVI